MTRIPTLEEIEKIELDSVRISFRSGRELRCLVENTLIYPERKPLEIVFSQVQSFDGSKDLEAVFLCHRGPSSMGDGFVFEFESREIVPTEGRPFLVQVKGPQDVSVLHGKTVCDIKARVIAGSVVISGVAG